MGWDCWGICVLLVGLGLDTWGGEKRKEQVYVLGGTQNTRVGGYPRGSGEQECTREAPGVPSVWSP